MYKGRRIEELERIVKEGILGYCEHTKYLETAEKMNERLLRARYLLACVYLRQGNTKKAVAQIKELERIVEKETPKYNEHISLETEEKLLIAHYLLGCAYLKQKNIEKAFYHHERFGNEVARIEEEDKYLKERLDWGTNKTIGEDEVLDSERIEIELKYPMYLAKQLKLSRKIRLKNKELKEKKAVMNPNYINMQKV